MHVTKLLILGVVSLALDSGGAAATADGASSFDRFRDGLERAVERRDWRWFEARMAKDEFLSSLGPGSGREEFVEMWEPQRVDSPLWPALDLIIAVSPLVQGPAGNGTCIGPTPAYDEEALLQEDRYALVGSAVPLRRGASIDAPVIAVVRGGWVTVVNGKLSLSEQDNRWVKIRTSADQEGYVDGYLLKSPVEPQLCYAQRGDEWRITGFVGGE